MCEHNFYQKELIETVYTDLIKISQAHSGYCLYNKICMDCDQSIGVDKVEFSNRAHYINSKGYCDCGFAYTLEYDSWTASNSSDKQVVVYQTPESITQYGYINAGEEVTVLAECCGRYLIQYTLDDGSGVKQGYVNKYSIEEEKFSYEIYINDVYFNAPLGTMVSKKGNCHQIYIKNKETNELISYGTDGLICVSSDENIVSIGETGTMVIRSTGGIVVTLMQNGEVLDSMTVYGCLENSRITNYSTAEGSQLYEDGVAVNCRLALFNYQSRYIGDLNEGYYVVEFDVYNTGTDRWIFDRYIQRKI